jgi:hypothetical protein
MSPFMSPFMSLFCRLCCAIISISRIYVCRAVFHPYGLNSALLFDNQFKVVTMYEYC